MREVKYNLVEREDGSNITVVVDGEMLVADDAHPLWNDIVEAAKADDVNVVGLFDASRKAASLFENLSERVTVANSRIYVDGDEIDDVYADQIVRFMDEGVDDFKPLVKFLEKVYTNIEAHTRENLSRWLNATNGFTIDEDGDIIGYKGLTAAGGSVHLGPAVVDGKAVDGSVPNAPGSVVEMARSKVEHNPNVPCASGLHVGTWEYASSFGQGVTAKVKVNPRDVVSVPTDCNGQKMRVSRYKVVEYVNEAHKTVVVPNDFVPTEDFLDGYDEGYFDGEVGNDYRYDDGSN